MKNLLYIGNQLHKHGFNKTAIETLGVFLAEEGYTVLYTSNKKNQIIRLLDMMLSTLLNAKKVDYILIDTYSTSSFWYTFFCSQIARLFKVKYIPILHGGDLPNRLQKNSKICKMIFNNSFTNVAPSNYLLSIFNDFGYENVIFIPNSIELKDYEYVERINAAPKLLWVRSFAEIYNPKMAIKVFESIKDKYPEAILTMIGPDKDGSLISTQELANQLKLSVTFTGKLTKEEWISLAKDYSIFINTTHFDNTPVSVIEAMALGLAVVSTNVGGIPYMLTNEKNALLVADNDVDQMIENIERLIVNNILFCDITKNANELVKIMDWQVVKEHWEKLLQ